MQKKLKVGCVVRQNVHFHDVSGRENRHFDAQNFIKENKKKYLFLLKTKENKKILIFFSLKTKENKRK